jgi:curved DNA-binding protein CbpA
VSDEGRQHTLEAWLAVLGSATHYELLGLLEAADEQAIQEAFHAFAEAFHPDRHRAESEAVREAVTRIFRRGAEAYRVLRDAKRRAAYDLELAKARPEGAGPSSLPPARSLDELCTTPGGKLHARQAERALTAGSLTEAHAFLTRALAAEGSNPELEARLADLEQLEALAGDEN